MKIDQLGAILKDAYETAPDKEKVAMIHLFGIKYAADLKNVSSKAVVAAAGIRETYATEVRKGVNLAKYVKVL